MHDRIMTETFSSECFECRLDPAQLKYMVENKIKVIEGDIVSSLRLTSGQTAPRHDGRAVPGGDRERGLGDQRGCDCRL